MRLRLRYGRAGGSPRSPIARSMSNAAWRCASLSTACSFWRLSVIFLGDYHYSTTPARMLYNGGNPLWPPMVVHGDETERHKPRGRSCYNQAMDSPARERVAGDARRQHIEE